MSLMGRTLVVVRLRMKLMVTKLVAKKRIKMERTLMKNMMRILTVMIQCLGRNQMSYMYMVDLSVTG